MGSYLTERTKIIGLLTPANTNINSGGAGKAFKLDSWQKATILVYSGVVNGNVTVLLYKGNVTGAVPTNVNTAMAYNYVLTNGASGYCEMNGTMTAATNAGVTIDNATYATSWLLAIEVNGQDMGTNYHWVGINTSATAAVYAAGLTYVAILSDSRYPEANQNMTTALT